MQFDDWAWATKPGQTAAPDQVKIRRDNALYLRLVEALENALELEREGKASPFIPLGTQGKWARMALLPTHQLDRRSTRDHLITTIVDGKLLVLGYLATNLTDQQVADPTSWPTSARRELKEITAKVTWAVVDGQPEISSAHMALSSGRTHIARDLLRPVMADVLERTDVAPGTGADTAEGSEAAATPMVSPSSEGFAVEDIAAGGEARAAEERLSSEETLLSEQGDGEGVAMATDQGATEATDRDATEAREVPSTAAEPASAPKVSARAAAGRRLSFYPSEEVREQLKGAAAEAHVGAEHYSLVCLAEAMKALGDGDAQAIERLLHLDVVPAGRQSLCYGSTHLAAAVDQVAAVVGGSRKKGALVTAAVLLGDEMLRSSGRVEPLPTPKELDQAFVDWQLPPVQRSLDAVVQDVTGTANGSRPSALGAPRSARRVARPATAQPEQPSRPVNPAVFVGPAVRSLIADLVGDSKLADEGHPVYLSDVVLAQVLVQRIIAEQRRAPRDAELAQANELEAAAALSDELDEIDARIRELSYTANELQPEIDALRAVVEQTGGVGGVDPQDFEVQAEAAAAVARLFKVRSGVLRVAGSSVAEKRATQARIADHEQAAVTYGQQAEDAAASLGPALARFRRGSGMLTHAMETGAMGPDGDDRPIADQHAAVAEGLDALATDPKLGEATVEVAGKDRPVAAAAGILARRSRVLADIARTTKGTGKGGTGLSM